jgi:hypothetical protein
LVVLDTMDLSNHPECANSEEAQAFAKAHPTDEHPQMALGRGYAHGGIGSNQLAWLRRTLAGMLWCGLR